MWKESISISLKKKWSIYLLDVLLKRKEIDKKILYIFCSSIWEFIFNKESFEGFREFLFDFINKEKEYIFEEIKADPEEKATQILILLNLTNELAGLNLIYSKIITNLFTQNINLNEFKSKFLNKIHSLIKKILSKREIGSTIIFNLKKMRNTQFSKYSNEILNIRRD